MKHLFGIMIIWIFVVPPNFGQKLNKLYVDNWIEEVFPNTKLDSEVIYIINGLWYGHKEVEKALLNFKRQELVVIDFLEQELIASSLYVNKKLSGIILLITEGNQPKKSIRQIFKESKHIYSTKNLRTTADINQRQGEPVLVINGKQIFHKDCHGTLNRLKISDIKGIHFIDKPVSKEIYGSNGENGLIMITTVR